MSAVKLRSYYQNIHGFNDLKNKINSLYGKNEGQNLKKWEQVKIKVIKKQNRLIFLKRCHRNNITPNFLKIKLPIIHTVKIDGIISKCQHKLLKETINSTYKELNSLKENEKKLFNHMNQNWNYPLPKIAENIINHRLEINDAKIKETQKKEI